jgi:hypothetical protein
MVYGVIKPGLPFLKTLALKSFKIEIRLFKPFFHGRED